MKTALLIGCGSKFGLDLLKQLLDQNWKIYSISGSQIDLASKNLTHLTIDWKTVTVANLEKFLRDCPRLDLIFFNQNSSALAKDNFTETYYTTLELWKQEKTWLQSYFVSCILPFHIVHSLGNRCDTNTKISWMLSSYIYRHSDIGNADYIGNKYQNYVLMKNFSQHHPSCFFGINPDSLANNNTEQNIKNLIAVVDSSDDINGTVIKFDKSEDNNFDQFI